ncbi:unnamed protein product [Auanema sp. JU1783]|nr:unnamed protein product [Auanema sp. JU1783]
MLSVPFLNKFINTVKRQEVADSVDYLNYYVTTMMLAFFSLAISAKQYFGSPIQCWVPNEFKGGWEKYAEDYCFIANSYHVPFEQENMPDHSERVDQISYYRWVPIMLAIQAVFFYLPNCIWNVLHEQTAINPRAFLSEADKIKDMTGEQRDKEISSLANYFMDTVSVFGTADYHRALKTSPRSGYNAMYLYLLVKASYVCNIFMQIVMLNHFLGEDYLHWGYQVAANILQGNEWAESSVFPRVIMCDFTIRRLGNKQNHTVQCVIMMNMINEKLYLLLYFWFLILLAATLINFFYYVVTMMVPSLRARLVVIKMNSRRKKGTMYRKRDVDRFVAECLHPDGVLLIQFLKEHAGGRVAFELTNKLLDLYTTQEVGPDYKSFSDDSIEKHPNSPLLEKYMRPPHYHYPENKQPYYPNIVNKAFENAPTMEDFIDGATLRVGDRKSSSPKESRSSPTEV